jgi:hypothetical protein
MLVLAATTFVTAGSSVTAMTTPPSSPYSLISITTNTNTDKEMFLESIQFQGVQGSIDLSSMVPVGSVFHYTPIESSQTTTRTIASPRSATAIPAGSRHTLLDGDAILNTGLASVGIGPGIPAGLLPASLPAGLGVTFASAIVNKPGYDIVVFDLANSSIGQDADSFYVSGIVGGNSIGATLVSSTECDVFSTFSQSWSPSIFRQDNTVANLSDLESKALTMQALGLTLPWTLRFYPIDLDDLNVAPLGSISGIFIQSEVTSLDPTFIAGLHVPEPGAALLFSTGFIGLAFIRLRRKSV